MKRHGKLWEKIIDLDNIKLAHRFARKGKLFYTEVKMVDADIDKYCLEIQQMLINKTFTTSRYEVSQRHDGKKQRVIHKLPYFPDRIIQHALLNIVGPIFVNSFIRDSFQSIRGRGTHDAMKRVKALVWGKDCPSYALKIDVRKYYPSVNNDLLKAAVRRKIKCRDTLWLIDDIIDSTQGLPIGNYTSQHFGNLYLNALDWHIKQNIKPSGYFRYCDDLVVFEKSVHKLLAIKQRIEDCLSMLRLQVKPSWSISNVASNGIDFVGYRFYPSFTRLRKNIACGFKKTCKWVRKRKESVDRDVALSKLMAYKGWVKTASAKRLWRQHISHNLVMMFPKQLRGAI
jgi:RNA-directed DNA polymerase